MITGKWTRLYRFVNTILFALLILLGISGVIMLYGAWMPWLFDLHRYAGWSLLALAPWKAVIIYHSLLRGMRRTFDRSAMLVLSLFFLSLILIVIILEIMWMWRIGPYQGPFLQTLIAWHWILGLALIPFFALHAWRRWPKPKKKDFSTRRRFLKMLGVASAGLLGGGLASRLARAQASQDSPRRFTGSRGFGAFTGNDFPITGEHAHPIDIGSWRLTLNGAVDSPLSLTYRDLLDREPDSETEVIDCTSGWYSLQDWQGVPLTRLLEEAGIKEGANGVRLVSVSGYTHTYPLGEARTILLATHVTGEVLAPRHGFPVRAVVPGRRGWFWVKWLTEINVLMSPWEVIGGILWSPRQILRQF